MQQIYKEKKNLFEVTPTHYRIKANIWPKHRSNLSASTPSTGIMSKLTRPLDSKTQHNCQIPHALFHFFYIFGDFWCVFEPNI